MGSREQKRPGLEAAISRTLDKRRSQSTIRQLTTSGPNSVDFSSNDFLSLASNAGLRELFLEELQRGPVATGSGGSRLLDGNSTYAENLERQIAAFHRAPAGLLCNSGFDANVGLFSCLPQPGDVIVHDELIHASVHDGMRLSRAEKCIYFAHNDMTALRRLLRSLLRDEAIRVGQKNVFVAVETIYSMDGDIAPLVEIVRLMKETFTAGNGHLIVDEAHSTGCFGPKGRGIVSELGLEGEVAVKLHTFGKALACNGAILLCSPLIREYLINYARPLIYTTFMSYPALAAIRASYQYLEEGKTEILAADLKMLIDALHSRLLALQEKLDFGSEAVQDEDCARPGELLRVSRECPQSPIFSVLSAEPKSLAAHCQRSGFMVRGIVPPTVPAGAERIRICLHAGNTVPQIENLVECIRRWVLTRRKESQETAPERARL
ncbi:hypothetical protein D0869_12478 [Hortaea werneckii]|uniref:Aminotransferase class I/classII large domain-containing protein n=1 Tax=Hortaea werneckii TaxID=91943 RepID=A0A3M6XVD6_HORWE|nr:hypothetical protein D0869_12478 [Hortaea werneckii]RMX94764.1 hypothetical protein D0868_12118 [Hortaea werneckii]